MKSKFLFLLLLLATLGVQAQDKLSAGVSLQYGLPMGAFKNNFVSNGSLRGGQLDLLYQVNPKWRIGGSIGYQDFYQKYDRQVYQLEDGSQLGAVLNNSVQVTPILAKAVYLPTPEKRFQPYVSLGVGGNLVQVSQLFGEFENYQDARFGFAAQGGLGVKYGLGAEKRTAITAGAVYNYMPFNHFEIGNLNHVGFQVGLRFTLRNDGNSSYDRDDDDRNRRPSGRYYGRW